MYTRIIATSLLFIYYIIEKLGYLKSGEVIISIMIFYDYDYDYDYGYDIPLFDIFLK